MEHKKGSKLHQFIAAVAGNLFVVACGAVVGWTSPVFVTLMKRPVDNDNPLGLPINQNEASWIGSLIALGGLVSSFLAGYTAERWGRRFTLLSGVIPFTVGWILILSATTVEIIYIARFIFGLAFAIPTVVWPMYCGEIAEASIRGILGSFFQISLTIGLLYSYCIGPYVSYKAFGIACGILPLISFAVFLFMPESPYYLSAKGRRAEAISALARLRGKTTDAVQAEADEIQSAVEEDYKRTANFMDLIKVKSNFKALWLICALMLFQQLSGSSVVMMYSGTIFASAGKSNLSSALESIIVALVQLGASFITPLVVDRCGRRILLMVSGAGTAVSLGTLGFFFYLKDVAKTDVTNIGWLPIASLVVFIATYTIGLGALPITLMSEVFSSEIKSKASGVIVFISLGSSFSTIKFFSDVTVAYGQHTSFWIFGSLCMMSVPFTLFFVPETKGKTLQEIQRELGATQGKVERKNRCFYGILRVKS